MSDELGLGVPAAELPEVDELVERLVRIRPEWDWQEPLDPAACGDAPSFADLSAAGIYNRAVIVPGERSPYTQGLETELKALAEMPTEQLEDRAWPLAGSGRAVRCTGGRTSNRSSRCCR